MKTMFLTGFILLNLIVRASAQSTDSVYCNRDVWIKGMGENMPEEVCIPHGYVLSHEYESIDINDDGLEDYIFKWRHLKLSDGDTLFVSIYTQTIDSTYMFFRTFDNLYPIFFQSNTIEEVKDKHLKELFDIYNGDPLKTLTFDKDEIHISFYDYSGGLHAGIFLTYKYDKDKNDWFLKKQKDWHDIADDTDGTLIWMDAIYTDLGEPESYQSINDFNYLDWIKY
jgi:hypothetical protein